MSADDYIAAMRRLQPQLFKANKLQITPEALELALRRAWESGRAAGCAEADNEKSLFQKVFGD